MTNTAPVTELPVYRAKIEPQWIDYNGHLRDAYYGLVASFAVDDVMEGFGRSGRGLVDFGFRPKTHPYRLSIHLLPRD